jgi:hypothetical protein
MMILALLPPLALPAPLLLLHSQVAPDPNPTRQILNRTYQLYHRQELHADPPHSIPIIEVRRLVAQVEFDAHRNEDEQLQ